MSSTNGFSREEFDRLTERHAHLTCEGCGATFIGIAKDAFDAGWDCMPWFVSHTTCPNCPITKTLWYMLISQKKYELDEAGIQPPEDY